MGLSRPNQNNNRKISLQGSQHRPDYKANDQGQKRSVPQQQRIFPKSDENNNANERPKFDPQMYVHPHHMQNQSPYSLIPPMPHWMPPPHQQNMFMSFRNPWGWPPFAPWNQPPIQTPADIHHNNA